MSTGIVKNRIEGTRITVWDVYHYLDHGCPREEIAEILRLPVDKILAAIDFIDENREFVEEGHRRIEERIARGNPPEIEEKLKETRKRMQAWLAERKRHIDLGTRQLQDGEYSEYDDVSLREYFDELQTRGRARYNAIGQDHDPRE